MSKNKLKGATLAFSALLALGGSVFAQDKVMPPVNGDRPGRMERGAHGPREFGRHGRHGKQKMGMALHALNLTDAQKTQLRALHESQRAQDTPQREEARRLMEQKRAGTLDANGTARLEQMRAAAKATRQARHNEMLAILTPEQKAQLERMKQERKDGGLNLTDAQREQVKAMHQRAMQAQGPQREEARRLMEQNRAGTLDANGTARLEQLHNEMKAAREAQRNEMLNILTPEQKAKFEQMHQNRGGRGRGHGRKGFEMKH